jgi:hypothetical protein
VPADGLVSILSKEPAGLSIGKVTLAGGEEVLGVLAEPFLTEVRILKRSSNRVLTMLCGGEQGSNCEC